MVMMRRTPIFFGTLIVTLFKLCCGVSTPSSFPYPSTSFPSTVRVQQASYKQKNSSDQARAQGKLASERQSSNVEQERGRSEIEGQSSINFPITNYDTANYEINHAPSNYDINHTPSNYIEATVTTIDDKGSSVKCNLQPAPPIAMYQPPLTQTPMYQRQDSMYQPSPMQISMYQSSPMQIQSPGKPMYSNPTGYQVAAPQQMYQSKARSNELQRLTAQIRRTSGQGSLTNYANQRGGYKIAQNSNQQQQMSSYSSSASPNLVSPKSVSPNVASPNVASPLIQGHSPGQPVVMVGGYAPPAPSTAPSSAPMQPLVFPCNHEGATSYAGGGGNNFAGGGNSRGGGSNYGLPSPPPTFPSGGEFNSRTNVVQQPCPYQCNQPSVMAPPSALPPMMMKYSPPPAPPPMNSYGRMTASPAPSMNYGSPMQSNNGPSSRNQIQSYSNPTVPRMTPPSQGHQQQQQLYQSTTRGQVPPAGTSSPYSSSSSPPAPPPPPTGNSYPASGQPPAGYSPLSTNSPAGYNPSTNSPAGYNPSTNSQAGFRQPRCMCKCEVPPGMSINDQPVMMTGYQSMGKGSSQKNHSPDQSSERDSGDGALVDNNYSTGSGDGHSEDTGGGGGGGSMDDNDPYGIDPSFDDVEGYIENHVFRRSGRQLTSNQSPPTFGQTPPTFGQAPPLLTNTNSNNSPKTGSYPTPPGGTQHLQQNKMIQPGGVPRQTIGMTPSDGQGRNQVQNQMRGDRNGAGKMNQGLRNANQKGANFGNTDQRKASQKSANFGNTMKLMDQLASPESLFEKLANKQFIIETNDDDLIDGTSHFPFASSTSLNSALSVSVNNPSLKLRTDPSLKLRTDPSLNLRTDPLLNLRTDPSFKLRTSPLTKGSLSSGNATFKVGTTSLISGETKDLIQIQTKDLIRTESDGSARDISTSESSSHETTPSSTPIPSNYQKEGDVPSNYQKEEEIPSNSQKEEIPPNYQKEGDVPSNSQKEEDEDEDEEDVNERVLGQPKIVLQPDLLTIEYSI